MANEQCTCVEVFVSDGKVRHEEAPWYRPDAATRLQYDPLCLVHGQIGIS